MKILFVTLSPIDSTFSTSFRNRAIIKGLLELSHEIDLVTINADTSNISINNIEILESLNIIRIDKKIKTVGYSNSRSKTKKKVYEWTRRIYHHLFPYDTSYFILKDIDISVLPKDSYDIIISSSDPKTSHLAAKQIIKKGIKYKKWVQYWGDPFASDITKKLLYPKRYILHLENNILKGADKIVYVSPLTLEDQMKHFGKLARKMSFLPIPYEKPKLFDEIIEDIYIVGYFGYYLSHVRNILPLYKAIANIGSTVQLNIVGGTDLDLKERQNISIYPISNNIIEHEKKSNLLIVVLNKFGSQIPGKLYHLAATNKPILVILDGEKKEKIKSYLETFDRFIMCDNTVESIKYTIKRIIFEKKQFVPCLKLMPKTIAKSLID